MLGITVTAGTAAADWAGSADSTAAVACVGSAGAAGSAVAAAGAGTGAGVSSLNGSITAVAAGSVAVGQSMCIAASRCLG